MQRLTLWTKWELVLLNEVLLNEVPLKEVSNKTRKCANMKLM